MTAPFLQSARSEPRYGAVLAGTFSLAIACFAGSTYYADHRMRDIARWSRAITESSLPCIEHLARVRTRLRDIERVATEATEMRGAPRSSLQPLLDAMITEEAGYARHVVGTPDEVQLWDHARRATTRVRALARSVIDEAERGEVDRARADLDMTLRPALFGADDQVRTIMELNAQHAEEAARQVEVSRRYATNTAYALDALSVFVAAVLAAIAIAVVRRYARLTERRAEELEQFASRVSHDIRGPLTPAVVALNWIEADLPPDSPKRRAVERGMRSLRTVESIVDGLLAFARAGAVPQTGARADLREAIDTVLSEAAPLAQAGGVDLVVDGEPPRAAVACAPGVLVSIVSNLVRNALKYIDGGRARRIVVRAAVSVAGARVEVEDTGPGLPIGMERKVFDPYVRARADGGGLGLGLATVKRLVEAHGGRAGVRAPSEGGAAFWFELPLARVERTEAGAGER